MDILSVIIVVWFTIKPYLLLISILVVTLMLSQFFGLAGWKCRAASSLWVLSAGTGIIAMLLAPTITDSSLCYVFTLVDKLSLLIVGVGSFVYSWILFRPWLVRKNIFKP
ncbi:hypothetical protein [Aeromonas salmonicida]|uniref:hypothetical protein n=1 Tax=Aeromonas salmonicida TaxID=645 RepID=UPI0039A73D9D